MRLKRTKLDIAFSDYIRARDRWHCVSCGKFYPMGMRQGLHCSHFFSRGNHAVRWDPENADAHCYKCHQKLGSNPHLFQEWKKKRMGEEKYKALVRRANTVRIWTPKQKEELYQQYKAQFKELMRDQL